MCGFSTRAANAQVQLDRFFPPVVAAGTQTLVTAEGKFPSWPPKVFCDSRHVTITAEKDSGKMTVDVSGESPPGVAWVRLYDDDSATNLVPIVISPVAVVSESEPNDKRSDANVVSVPAVVAGRLSKGGDSDSFRVSIKAGQTFVATVMAHRVLRSPMDAVLQLTDLRGNVLFQSDDERGLDPQIVYSTDVDQEVLLRVFAFPETPNSTVGFGGSAAFVYSIDVTTGPSLDHVAGSQNAAVPFGFNLPDECMVSVIDPTSISPAVAFVPGALGWSWLPSADPATEPATDPATQHVLPGQVFDGTVPAVLYGHIARPGEVQHFAFAADKGVKYRVEVKSKSDGFLLDSTLTIADQKSGDVLASNDDVSRNVYDAGVDVTAKDDGVIDVALSDALGGFGPHHYFQLSIHPSRASCRLSLAADHFVVKRDKPLEVAVAIDRVNGLNEKVRITATGLPPGITAEPVISEPKGGTAKSVKLKLVASQGAAGHGSFHVVGSLLGPDDQPTGATVDATFSLRPAVSITEFWLTTGEK
ncbi:MAG: hypothetical protein KDB00_05255 [Planctomycetales bacterium]|nr:hypothetical protein [Planctomycetales bacterium]